MTGKTSEAQDKPVWEEKGYESAEHMFDEMMQDTVAEKARADSLEATVSAVKPPEYPEFDSAAYADDPEGYSASHKKRLDTYNLAVQSGVGSASAAVLEATLNSELARAEKKGYDSDVVQGIIRSMVKNDSTLRAKLDTIEGLKELAKKATEKLKAQTPLSTTNVDDDEDDSEDKTMANGVPPEHRDRPGRSSIGARQSTPKQSEVERLDVEINTLVTAGRGATSDIVRLAIERNLAQLGVEKPKK